MKKERCINALALLALVTVTLATAGCDERSSDAGYNAPYAPVAPFGAVGNYQTPTNVNGAFSPIANQPSSRQTPEATYQYGYLVGGWDWAASDFSSGLAGNSFYNLNHPESDPYLITIRNGLDSGMSPVEAMKLGDSYMEGWNARYEEESKRAQRKHEEELRRIDEQFENRTKNWNFGYTL